MKLFKLIVCFMALVLGLIAPSIRADDFYWDSQKVLGEHMAADGWSKATAKEEEMLGWVVTRQLKIFFVKIDVTETYYPYLVQHAVGNHNNGQILKIIGYTETETQSYIKDDNGQFEKSTHSTSKDFDYFPGEQKLGEGEMEMTPKDSFLLAFKHEEDCEKSKAGFKNKYGTGFFTMTCEVSEKALDSNGDLKADAGLTSAAIEDGLYNNGCVYKPDPEGTSSENQILFCP